VGYNGRKREKCTIRSFIICIFHQIFGRSNQGGLDGHASGDVKGARSLVGKPEGKNLSFNRCYDNNQALNDNTARISALGDTTQACAPAPLVAVTSAQDPSLCTCTTRCRYERAGPKLLHVHHSLPLRARRTQACARAALVAVTSAQDPSLCTCTTRCRYPMLTENGTSWQNVVNISDAKFNENPFTVLQLSHAYRQMDGVILMGALWEWERAWTLIYHYYKQHNKSSYF
jgi:hypothetical protein